MKKARIFCEVTCNRCGALAYNSTYYKNYNTIKTLKENTKDWVLDDKYGINLCPKCQSEIKNNK